MTQRMAKKKKIPIPMYTPGSVRRPREPPWSREAGGDLLVPERPARAHGDRIGREPVARRAGEQLLDRHPCLEPGERRAEAEVDAPPEREVPRLGAPGIEGVGCGELPAVTVRRAPDQEHARAG